ncbi:hypothetical protein BO78DRAFT_420174 [Aspergillus sclerotiicarbonarius CBS 121057]|uniref:Uncharacterized protein n=1 Tax=Aspergillus sclerotiicarbonarius (strain CBS 121057 / IBT 28362) TaxID=1448318 RepID=A0A319EU27_ASPSB|nr:hypothetical protein BO78DRAFT_420174 [Aspergillus sclerotiicarbonarius CBS 121057]
MLAFEAVAVGIRMAVGARALIFAPWISGVMSSWIGATMLVSHVYLLDMLLGHLISPSAPW